MHSTLVHALAFGSKPNDLLLAGNVHTRARQEALLHYKSPETGWQWWMSSERAVC